MQTNTKSTNSLAIRRGKITRPQKVVIYGPEGVGKSTLAGQTPEPVFLDTEGGTHHLDVARLDAAATWEEITATVTQLAKADHPFKTLVIDTLIPPDPGKYSWAGHLGKRMQQPVVDEIAKSGTTLVFTNVRSQAEIWYQLLLEAKLDPEIPALSTFMACSTSMMAALEAAHRGGGWVLLQNVHLTIDWTSGPLEKRVDKLAGARARVGVWVCLCARVHDVRFVFL